MDKNYTVCFTGHRDIIASDLMRLDEWLRAEVLKSISEGYRFFIAGGALGFDTLAAKTVLKLRKDYPDIRLILALPCHSQAKYWKSEDIKEYERIKEKADAVVYTSDEYTRSCMFKRNRYLVDSSTLCICYLKKSKGGTAYTVRYAENKGVKIINFE